MSNLFDTQYAKTTGLAESVTKATKFLMTTPSAALSTEVMDQIFQSRVRTTTSLSVIFEHLAKSRARDIFSGFYPLTGNNTTDVPSILATSSITIDMQSLPATHQFLKTLPMYNRKVIVNLKGLVRYVGAAGDTPFVTDNHELYSLFVRGLLCRSYGIVPHGKAWLTPSLALFIVESFATCFSSQIARTVGLNFEEVRTVATCLALYMCQKIWVGHYSNVPPLFYACTFLGDKKYLEDFVKQNTANIAFDMNPDKLCDLMVATGPQRLRSFDSAKLNTLSSILCSDRISSLIAVEYPPYWVHQILLTLAGGKPAILSELKRAKMVKDAQQFAHDLNTSKSFIDEIEVHHVSG